MLSTNDGRAAFWAESAMETAGIIHFVFPNGLEWDSRILEVLTPRVFSVEYLGRSKVTFELHNDGNGGTDLLLTETDVPDDDRVETIAGWVSVLMALKAAVDHNVDLRGHDPKRNWDGGYVEN